ncbi:hypothetical protein LOTGIDRAFT_175491 [Lottia gigantea]|uniref:EGF-like domain-containing protein n=1 Tax=Lottia gigantea TaxID=225164 RepID=V4ABC5_LOTGI|nr:hypothetical protein LOTGIDRAFT_175491 [Lottia gigantea]ESO94112.1 hypothetical protein LOTGIDRAFT_175491 [Lottia gigantea]
MNNLLCSALLISVILILTDADCKNGGILVEENGTLKCNCPPNTFGDDCNCRYKFTNVTFLEPDHYGESAGSDSAKCDENCAIDTRCSTSTMLPSGKTCYHYETPIILVTYDRDEDKCIGRCNEMSECKTFGIDTGMNSACVLFNVTLDKIPDKMKRAYQTFFKAGEKICE